MAIPGIQEIQALAINYSKPRLQQMARMGLIDPTKAVLAGMMIDRIQKQNMQMPQQTVADEVLGPSQAGGFLRDRYGNIVRSGSGQPVRTGIERDRFGNPVRSSAAQESLGMTALPSGLPEDMAGGGIVAFADGGDIPGYADGELVSEPTATYLPGNIDFESGNLPVYRSKAPEQISLQQAAQARKEAETQAGVSPTFFEDLRKDVLADKEDFAKQKNEAKGMALIQFGIGMLGARKGREGEAASASGQQALLSYSASLKEIRMAEKELKKSVRDLNIAENAYKRSNAEKDLAKVDAAKEKVQAHEDNFAKALNEGVKNKLDLFKDKRQRETQIRVSEIGKEGLLAATAMRQRAERNPQIELVERIQNDPKFAETWKTMQADMGKQEAEQKLALSLMKEYNDLGYVAKQSLETQGIKNENDYVTSRLQKLKSLQQGGGAGGGGVVVQTPQGAIRFNTQAEADAFKKQVGLK